MISNLKYRPTPEDKIKTIVAKLDYKWFHHLYSEFQKLCQDGDDFFEIDNTPDDYNKYWNSLTAFEKSNSHYDFSQVVYWDQYCFDEGYSTAITTGRTVIDDIIQATVDIIISEGAAGDYTACKVHVFEVKSWVKESVLALLGKHSETEYIDVITAFSQHCIRDLDRWLIKKKQSLETNNKLALIADATNGLEAVINPAAIPTFMAIEQQLFDEGYIDFNRKWCKHIDDCASYINRLLIKGYVVRISPGMEKWITKTAKPFFEKRYKVTFTKQLQKGYRKKAKLRFTFTWIDQFKMTIVG